MQTALFIGRFQPLHKGHLTIIKHIAKNHNLKIGIGSSQYKHIQTNPLSATERRKIIKQTLKKENIKAKIYFIPDVHQNARWVSHVKKRVGPFNLTYSGNPLVIRLFKKKNIQVKTIKLIQPYSSTSIRNKIKQNKQVKSQLPTPVYTFLKKIKAFKRIKLLNK
jgi:nicotinamide-nucleotide adenylyltransferase